MFPFRSFSIAVCTIALTACASGSDVPRPIGPPYTPDRLLSLPRPFEVGTISTDADEYGPTFSPDGRTLYLVKRIERGKVEFIYSSQFSRGKWSAPRVTGFSGQWFDKEPFVTPDGKQIFFSSNRPLVRGAPIRDMDIWTVTKKFRGWRDPVRVDLVNSDSTDSYPTVTRDGTLYFASNRPGGRGDYDLYRTRLIDGRYTAPENLGDAINTSGNEADPYIAPDESYMIFSSIRPGGYGEGDLYITFNSAAGWSTPQILPTSVNSSEYEYTPLVTPDGKFLFFSRGWGEIFQVDLAAAGVNLSR